MKWRLLVSPSPYQLSYLISLSPHLLFYSMPYSLRKIVVDLSIRA